MRVSEQGEERLGNHTLAFILAVHHKKHKYRSLWI